MNIEHEILKNGKSIQDLDRIIESTKVTLAQIAHKFERIDIPFVEEEDDDETHESFCYFDKHNKLLSALFTGIRLDKYGQLVFLGRDNNGQVVEVWAGYVIERSVLFMLQAVLLHLEAKEINEKINRHV